MCLYGFLCVSVIFFSFHLSVCFVLFWVVCLFIRLLVLEGERERWSWMGGDKGGETMFRIHGIEESTFNYKITDIKK